MAEKGQTRDPSSHRTPGQITRMNHTYDNKPEAIQKRANNNKARAMLVKEGLLKKGDGKDVHHKKPQRAGGATVRSNITPRSRHENRGWEKEKGRK